MQTFCPSRSGKIYYSQTKDDYVYITRASGPDAMAWSLDNAMKIQYSGHGCTLVAEEAADGKTYVWVGTNGNQVGTSKDYQSELSVSRIEFQPGVSYVEQGGDTYFHSGHLTTYISIDFDNRRFCAGGYSGNLYCCTTFDLDDVLNLPKKEISFTVRINGANVKRTVIGHDLADLTPLGEFTAAPPCQQDESSLFHYYHQGQCVYGDYVYIMEGATITVADGKNCKAYVTVFDIYGNIVMPRTEVMAACDRDKWFELGYLGSLEPEGVYADKDGVYLGFVSKPVVSTDPRKTHILKYKCNLCKKNN